MANFSHTTSSPTLHVAPTKKYDICLWYTYSNISKENTELLFLMP